MEPLQSIPYNLRSRGRVIGNRLLRLRRGVPVDNSSVKHHHRQKPCKPSVNKVQKPRGPSIHSCPCEELGNQIPNNCETIEEENRQCRLWYMEKFRPQPLVAMQHYNKNLKEEEQYKVYDSKGQIIAGYDKVGFFHLLYFTAVPKSFENMQNPSDDVPVKHFYARVHEAPKQQTHVDYCEQGPPLRGKAIAVTRVVPLSCNYCGLADVHAIKSRSSELSNQGKADGEYESDSDNWDGYSDAPKKRRAKASQRSISRKKEKALNQS